VPLVALEFEIQSSVSKPQSISFKLTAAGAASALGRRAWQQFIRLG
jgi:hypothetical protein